MIDFMFAIYLTLYRTWLFLLTTLTFQCTPFFRTICSTIVGFKISTSLISNRYLRCAITMMMTEFSNNNATVHRNHFNVRLMKKGGRAGYLNDASVNVSIRLYLRVMIIMRQESGGEKKRDDKKFFL
jgi:hypothetical protein